MPRQVSANPEVSEVPSSSPSIDQSQQSTEEPIHSLSTQVQAQVQVQDPVSNDNGNQDQEAFSTQTLEFVPNSSHHVQHVQAASGALEVSSDQNLSPQVQTNVDDSHLDQGVDGYTFPSHTYTQRIPASRTGLVRPTMSLTYEAPRNTAEKAQPGIVTTCVFGLIGIAGVTLFFIRRWRRNRTRSRGEIIVQNLDRAKRQQAHIRDSEFENLKIDPLVLEQGDVDVYNDVPDEPSTLISDELQAPAKVAQVPPKSLNKSKEDHLFAAPYEDQQRHSFSTIKTAYAYAPTRPSPLRF